MDSNDDDEEDFGGEPECPDCGLAEDDCLCCEECGDSPCSCHFDDDEEPPQCSTCGGLLLTLGVLGNRTHYQCRNCGMQASAIAEQEMGR